MSTDLPTNSLAYALRDGYVVNWLVAGPHLASDLRRWDTDPGIEGRPVERGPLGTGEYRVDDETGTWAYLACPDDNMVDLSAAYLPGQHLRAWAYCELVVDEAQTVSMELTAFGPAGLWLDGEHVLRGESGSTRARVQLRAGVNPLLVRFEEAGGGRILDSTAYTMSLRIESEGEPVHVQIPTMIEDVGRRTAFEELTAATFLDRDVYVDGTPISLRWPDGERALCPVHVRLHGPDDAIFALADVPGAPGDVNQLGYALQLPAGPMRVTLMPSPDEVYLHNTRVVHQLPFWSMGRQRYVATPPAETSLELRRAEALAVVAERADSPYGQLARMALGAWADVDANVLTRAAGGVAGWTDHCLLLTLTGMLHRFRTQPEFPAAIGQAVERALLSYDQWSAPGSEASRILRHAAQVLAGQLAPDRPFADGQSGVWHRAEGERGALAWMTAFASRGSEQPGAPHEIEQSVVALAHLADLAESPAVYELAAVCLDKLLFLLAVHSRQGVLGAATPTAPPSSVTSGLLQPTAPISRLLWGTGIYNHHLAGVLSLALATDYEPPEILAAIAHDAPAELWSRERHAPNGTEPTSLVTFKTPDYMLSSLAAYSPARPGYAALMWRATLSPEAVVFANQPGSSSESDSRLPGYWAGNARVPWVAQWHDALIAIHHVAGTDRLPWTHAYFPCATFEEYVLRDGWAFARVGDGYLALTNSAGMQLTQEGRYAFRELRAVGSVQAWLVQMGRAALDGDFLAFQSRVLAAAYVTTPEGIHWKTIRGDELRLIWDRPLHVNGMPQALPEGQHVENPYTSAALPCTSMDIRMHDDLLRLDFIAP